MKKNLAIIFVIGALFISGILYYGFYFEKFLQNLEKNSATFCKSDSDHYDILNKNDRIKFIMIISRLYLDQNELKYKNYEYQTRWMINEAYLRRMRSERDIFIIIGKLPCRYRLVSKKPRNF